MFWEDISNHFSVEFRFGNRIKGKKKKERNLHTVVKRAICTLIILPYLNYIKLVFFPNFAKKSLDQDSTQGSLDEDTNECPLTD